MGDFQALADRRAADIGAVIHQQAAHNCVRQADLGISLAVDIDPLLRAGDLDLPLVAALGDVFSADRDLLVVVEFHFLHGFALIGDGEGAVVSGTDHGDVGHKEDKCQDGRHDPLIQFAHTSALLSNYRNYWL